MHAVTYLGGYTQKVSHITQGSHITINNHSTRRGPQWIKWKGLTHFVLECTQVHMTRVAQQ